MVRIGGGLAFQGGMFELRRMPPRALAELVDLVLQRLADLGGALGELLQQLDRDTGDLGLTLDDLTEGDAVPVRELGTQHRLIQTAEGALVMLQYPGVQRQPAAIIGLHLGRDHQVRV